MELWFPVPGWEGLYEVSDAGGVRSVDRVVLAISPRTGRPEPRRYCGRILHAQVTPGGYALVSLTAPGRPRYSAYVHDLVAAVFIGPQAARSGSVPR